jgi:3alpha(or 20beta)-hydroxysteroid dehydrogenase
MGRLSGKVALVTGAARGSGEAMARLFVAEGAKVVVTDILDELGGEVAASLGEAAIYRRLDVTVESDWETVVADAVETFGLLDVVVNNAAILEFGTLSDTSVEAFMRTVTVNQLGTFLGMRAAVEPMRKAGGGSIINISSVDGLRGLNGVFAYSSTKWAVRGMAKCAALELGHLGIRVNSIHPGGVATPMNDPHAGDMDIDAMFANQAIPRLAEADEVARLTLFLASDDSSYCTGSEFTADGGWTAGIREPALPGLES